MKPTSIFVHNHGHADTVATHEPLKPHDTVTRLPYKQVEIDGTKCAPAWAPPDQDNNDPRLSDRSHEASVRQLNPAGDPTHQNRQHQNIKLPAATTATVSFSSGRKIVSQPSTSQTPAQNERLTIPSSSTSYAGRRKIVGAPAQPKNPSAPLTPLTAKSVKTGVEGNWSEPKAKKSHATDAQFLETQSNTTI